MYYQYWLYGSQTNGPLPKVFLQLRKFSNFHYSPNKWGIILCIRKTYQKESFNTEEIIKIHPISYRCWWRKEKSITATHWGRCWSHSRTRKSSSSTKCFSCIPCTRMKSWLSNAKILTPSMTNESSLRLPWPRPEAYPRPKASSRPMPSHSQGLSLGQGHVNVLATFQRVLLPHSNVDFLKYCFRKKKLVWWNSCMSCQIRFVSFKKRKYAETPAWTLRKWFIFFHVIVLQLAMTYQLNLVSVKMTPRSLQYV